MDILSSLWGGFGSLISKILPLSPFSKYINQLSGLPYLGYLNWFIPIGTILTIFATYLGAVAIYYLYTIILRWVRAIE